MEGALSYFNLMEIFDLSARGKLDLAFLGGAQIDEHGDMNLSFIGDPAAPKVRLPGGAGSAHILPTAQAHCALADGARREELSGALRFRDRLGQRGGGRDSLVHF